MPNRNEFLKLIRDNFPEDRLTWQQSVPTFHPETVQETADLFKLANREKQPLFIAGFGNNISPVGEKFAGIVAVKSDRLNRIIQIVPADYYVTVGAGYPLRELKKALARENLFSPMAELPYVGSVGGALAVGLTADYLGHDLPISRYFIMGEIADPTGRVLRPGSRCFKSVSGLEIVKIYSPSWGLLGMIVTATLRVLPVSEYPQYEHITMHEIDYKRFAETYRNPGDNVSAQYSLKIKQKFDPNAILPLVG